MISTLLLTMIGIALLSVLIGAYQVSAKARYRDRARFVIKSFADQFLTQEAIDPASGNVFPLFTITVNTSTGAAMPKGTGMVWTNSDGSQGTMSTDSQNAFFYVLLADSTNNGLAITAQVTRQVSYVYASSGSPTLVNQNATPGYMLEGDFTITYPYLNTTQTQTVTAIRAVP